MVKVTLINPPIGVAKRYGKLKSVGSVVPPLGLCYLASVLEHDGHTVRILDGELLDCGLSDIVKLIDLDTDVIGITSSTVGISNTVELAKLIKKWNGDVPIVLGGPHVTALPVDTLKMGVFDFGVIGEGEITMSELVGSIDGDPSGIDGLAYLRDGEVVMNKKRSMIEDMDSIPFPSRHLLEDLKSYRPNVQNYKRLPATTMMTSRGCPFGCIFCDKSVFGRSYRVHSARYVVDEIQMLIEKYKINEIWLMDDTFTLDNERVITICNLILERGLKVSWNCSGQVSTVNPQLLALMKKAGCWMISYGIESGNQRILDNTGKNITLKQVKQAINWTKEANIQAKGFLILGLPHETLETIDDTINFVRSVPLDQVVFTIATPLPNTELYDWAVENDLISHTADWSSFNMFSPTYCPAGLNPEILKKKMKEAFFKFYLRPSYVLRQLKGLESLADLKRKILGLIGLLSL